MLLQNRFLIRNMIIFMQVSPELRDDCLLLVKNIHDAEMKVMGSTKENYYELLFSGKLSNVNTINRLWRLIQEKHPYLRGNTWAERQMNAGLIRSEINGSKSIANQLNLF
jgi:hypothetical protein